MSHNEMCWNCCDGGQILILIIKNKAVRVDRVCNLCLCQKNLPKVYNAYATTSLYLHVGTLNYDNTCDVVGFS